MSVLVPKIKKKKKGFNNRMNTENLNEAAELDGGL